MCYSKLPFEILKRKDMSLESCIRPILANVSSMYIINRCYYFSKSLYKNNETEEKFWKCETNIDFFLLCLLATGSIPRKPSFNKMLPKKYTTQFHPIQRKGIIFVFFSPVWSNFVDWKWMRRKKKDKVRRKGYNSCIGIIVVLAYCRWPSVREIPAQVHQFALEKSQWNVTGSIMVCVHTAHQLKIHRAIRFHKQNCAAWIY